MWAIVRFDVGTDYAMWAAIYGKADNAAHIEWNHLPTSTGTRRIGELRLKVPRLRYCLRRKKLRRVQRMPSTKFFPQRPWPASFTL